MKGTWPSRYLKSRQHGNFHFSGDWITFKRQGILLLRLRDLEYLYGALAIQAHAEGKDAQDSWWQFNCDIQKLIDDKLEELEPGHAEAALERLRWPKAGGEHAV